MRPGRRALLVLAASAIVARAAVAQPVAADAAPWLADEAAARGIEFVHQRATERRSWLPEIMSGGVCLIEHDRDGAMFVFLVRGG